MYFDLFYLNPSTAFDLFVDAYFYLQLRSFCLWFVFLFTVGEPLVVPLGSSPKARPEKLSKMSKNKVHRVTWSFAC